MSIKTPVKVNSSNQIVDAESYVVATCSGPATANIIAHALNTHAALRASHAELVDAVKTAEEHEVGSGEISCALRTVYRTALSNAAKVEVPNA